MTCSPDPVNRSVRMITELVSGHEEVTRGTKKVLVALDHLEPLKSAPRPIHALSGPED